MCEPATLMGGLGGGLLGKARDKRKDREARMSPYANGKAGKAFASQQAARNALSDPTPSEETKIKY